MNVAIFARQEEKLWELPSSKKNAIQNAPKRRDMQNVMKAEIFMGMI